MTDTTKIVAQKLIDTIYLILRPRLNQFELAILERKLTNAKQQILNATPAELELLNGALSEIKYMLNEEWKEV